MHRVTKQDIWNEFAPFIFWITVVIVATIVIALCAIWLPIEWENWLSYARNWGIAEFYETGVRSQPPFWQYWNPIIHKYLNVLLSLILVAIATSFMTCYLMSVVFTDNPQTQRWVVTYRDRIVGSATILVRDNYSLLQLIQLQYHHWFQGIGSYLVWKSIIDARKPVYLYCSSRLQPFYQRFGFVPIRNQDCPRELLFPDQNIKLMGLLDPPILPRPNRPNSLQSSYSIRGIENLSEQIQIYQRFWSRTSFRRSRIYVFWLMVIVAVAAVVAIAIFAKIWDWLVFLGIETAGLVIVILSIVATFFFLSLLFFGANG